MIEEVSNPFNFERLSTVVIVCGGVGSGLGYFIKALLVRKKNKKESDELDPDLRGEILKLRSQTNRVGGEMRALAVQVEANRASIEILERQQSADRERYDRSLQELGTKVDKVHFALSDKMDDVGNRLMDAVLRK